MIRDRYDAMDLFALVPQLHLHFEPELAALDRLLDDDTLFQQVKADLARRRPLSAVTGRGATPVEVILRMLVVKHWYGWSYDETERCVGDSLVLRQFCRLYLAPAPDDTTLLRWANLLRPETLQALNAHVLQVAQQLRITRGRKLRTDSTVVETPIHYPSDSSRLADSVRVLSRLVSRARAVLPVSLAQGRRWYRNRTRSAKQLAQQVSASTARAPAAATAHRRALYTRLLAVARASLRQADQVRQGLATTPGRAATRLRDALAGFAPRVRQVIAQTERRVLRGEPVPAAEKVLSVFAPHTAVIRRGKVRQPAEFGTKVVLDEVAGGLVSRYALVPGNPPDALSVPVSLAQHQVHFGHPPDLLAGDRGMSTPENERLAATLGVRRIVLPHPGGTAPARRAQERQRWFRRGYRFRAGVEGRISVLKRGFGLHRCRYHGEAGMARWVGWGVLAHNLRQISRTVARRRAA
jgi:IS5 family transposase